jgi:hypothetical protein
MASSNDELTRKSLSEPNHLHSIEYINITRITYVTSKDHY